MQTYGSFGGDEPKREPNFAEILCQGYLGMSFGAKGFMYYHYYPFYSEGSLFTPNLPASWRGAKSRGLTDLWQSPDDSTIDDQEALDSALSSGILVPNEKWYAVNDFIDYVRRWESVYVDLENYDSQCAADDPTVSYVTVDSSYWYHIPENPPPDSVMMKDNAEDSFIQIGVFRSVGNRQYFMLVNRRCDEGGGRWVRCTLNEQGTEYISVSELQANNWETKSHGYGDRTFAVYLPPGTGRLYRVTRDGHSWGDTTIAVSADIRGDILIPGSVTVNSGVTLTIRPGSSVLFSGDGSLTVNGTFNSQGNNLSEDSLISFNTFDDSKSGIIQPNGSTNDYLSYCKLKHLDRGISVSKSGSSKVLIDHCEFSFNADEGLYVTGGEVTVTASTFRENGDDELYLYNTKATLDLLTVTRNANNGLYANTVNSSSTITNSTFLINGGGSAITRTKGGQCDSFACR